MARPRQITAGDRCRRSRGSGWSICWSSSNRAHPLLNARCRQTHSWITSTSRTRLGAHSRPVPSKRLYRTLGGAQSPSGGLLGDTRNEGWVPKCWVVRSEEHATPNCHPSMHTTIYWYQKRIARSGCMLWVIWDELWVGLCAGPIIFRSSVGVQTFPRAQGEYTICWRAYIRIDSIAHIFDNLHLGSCRSHRRGRRQEP